MIKASPEQLRTVKKIIFKRLKNARVLVFGSRVAGEPSESSDLDIAVISKDKINMSDLAQIKMDFEEVPLPFRVDIVDYNSAGDSFKRIIDSNSEEI